jgi:hypothetical protein
MRHTLIAAVALVIAGAATAQPVLAAVSTPTRDYDCKDFPTRQAAQAFYLNNGGPTVDVYHLDVDRDGKACERLIDGDAAVPNVHEDVPGGDALLDATPVAPVHKPDLRPTFTPGRHITTPK